MTYPPQPNNPQGIFVPRGWNANWAPKLASGSATIAFAGDSVTRGYYASSLRNKGWAGLLATALQNAHGDGGSGFISMELSTVIAGTTWPSAEMIVTSAGPTKFTGGGTNDGFGLLMQTAGASGSAQTFTVQGRGDHIVIYGLVGGASFTYTVDGGASQGPVSFAAVPGHTTSIGQVDAGAGHGTGNHTVVLTVAASTAAVYFYGVSFYNATGIIAHNFGHAGYTSSALATAPSATGDDAGYWQGGAYYPADLVVYGMGVNDANSTVAPDTYLDNVRVFLNHVRDLGGATGTTDLLIVRPHIGTFDSASPGKYHQYGARLRGLAEDYGAALVDFWAIGRNSWQKWQTAGYWSDGTSSGLAGSNAVHPSDNGHAYMESVLEPLVASTLAA